MNWSWIRIAITYILIEKIPRDFIKSGSCKMFYAIIYMISKEKV